MAICEANRQRGRAIDAIPSHLFLSSAILAILLLLILN